MQYTFLRKALREAINTLNFPLTKEKPKSQFLMIRNSPIPSAFKQTAEFMTRDFMKDLPINFQNRNLPCKLETKTGQIYTNSLNIPNTSCLVSSHISLLLCLQSPVWYSLKTRFPWYKNTITSNCLRETMMKRYPLNQAMTLLLVIQLFHYFGGSCYQSLISYLHRRKILNLNSV